MIIDTNALSAYADSDPNLVAQLPSDRPWYLPSVVVGEYRYGLQVSSRRIEKEAWLSLVIS